MFSQIKKQQKYLECKIRWNEEQIFLEQYDTTTTRDPVYKKDNTILLRNRNRREDQ